MTAFLVLGLVLAAPTPTQRIHCRPSDLVCAAASYARRGEQTNDAVDFLLASRAHLALFRSTRSMTNLCEALRLASRASKLPHQGDRPEKTVAEANTELSRLSARCPAPQPATATSARPLVARASVGPRSSPPESSLPSETTTPERPLVARAHVRSAAIPAEAPSPTPALSLVARAPVGPRGSAAHVSPPEASSPGETTTPAPSLVARTPVGPRGSAASPAPSSSATTTPSSPTLDETRPRVELLGADDPLPRAGAAASPTPPRGLHRVAEGPEVPTAPSPPRAPTTAAGRGLFIAGGLSLGAASVLGGVATYAAVRVERAIAQHAGLADVANLQGFTAPAVGEMRRELEAGASHWRRVMIGTSIAAAVVTTTAVALIAAGAAKRRHASGRRALHLALPGLLWTARF